MSRKNPPPEEFELSPRTSQDSDNLLDDLDDTPESRLLAQERGRPVQSSPSLIQSLFHFLWRPYKRRHSPRSATRSRLAKHRSCCRRSLSRKFVYLSWIWFAVLVCVTIIGGALFPSYTHLPPHYQYLKQQVHSSARAGRANVNLEKIFIAASIFDPDGKLARGAWGNNVLDLVELLGPENVYLSIYENDAGDEAKQALLEFEQRVTSDSTIVFEDHLGYDQVPHVNLPDGSERVKRIAYLAEIRNRALRPLETSKVRFDKLLYLNDIVFDPLDAAQLLFSTNTDPSGRAQYRAACAVDFINPFKFYDTFATRDLEGYSMGVPFFPWFSSAGDAQSRREVMSGSDSVRVRSCWGGMVAFDAIYFQASAGESSKLETSASIAPLNQSAPYRFRAEEDLYWDASECCLIQADIQSTEATDPGIYMNPFVRVAYDSTTLSWLGFTRRFERLYSPIQFLVNIIAAMPRLNPRRDEQPWQSVQERVWVPDSTISAGGSFQMLSRTGSHSSFCGRPFLQLMKLNPQPGEKTWEPVPLPA